MTYTVTLSNENGCQWIGCIKEQSWSTDSQLKANQLVDRIEKLMSETFEVDCSGFATIHEVKPLKKVSDMTIDDICRIKWMNKDDNTLENE